MQHETVVNDVSPGAPMAFDARMYLTGTLHRRGNEFVIEQQLALDTGTGPHWTTRHIRRVMASETTHAALQAHLDQVVTIIGTPDSGDTRHRTTIVLESIQPLGPVSEHY